jgi:hypothetical protein
VPKEVVDLSHASHHGFRAVTTDNRAVIISVQSKVRVLHVLTGRPLPGLRRQQLYEDAISERARAYMDAAD